MTEPRRYGLAALLTGAMATGAMMQFAIGALGPALTDDLGLSRGELGALGALYYLAAAALSRGLGRRVDAVGSRVALAALFTGGALAPVLAALAPSYAWLLLAMLPAGALAAAGNPVTNKVIAGLPGRRGALTGLKQSGVQLSALVAGGLLPPLATAVGWRPALAGVGAACLAGLGGLRWLPPDPPPARREDETPADALSRTVRRLGLYAFCMGLGMASITAFVPLYGVEVMGFGHATAGMLLAVIAVGGIASRVAWSARAEQAEGGAGAALPLLALAAVAGTGLIAAGEATGAWALWAGAVVLGLSAAAWNAVAMLALLVRAPRAVAGHASGRMLTAFFLGLAVSAPVFGAIVDATGDYAAGWAVVAAAFAVAALVGRGLAAASRTA